MRYSVYHFSDGERVIQMNWRGRGQGRAPSALSIMGREGGLLKKFENKNLGNAISGELGIAY